MLTATKKADIAESSRRAIATLAVPLVLAAVSSIVSDAVDIAVIGRVDAPSLAAVASAVVAFEIVSNVLAASLVAHRATAAQAMGGGDAEAAGRSFGASLRFGLTAATIGAVLLVSLGEVTVTAITGSNEVGQLARGYLIARAPALLVMIPLILLTSSAAAQRLTRFSLYSALVSNALNVLLDFPLVFGLGPIPALGVVGDGLATSIGMGGALVVIALLSRRAKLLDGWRIRRHLISGRWFDGEVLRVGGPSMVSAAVDYLGNLAFFFVLGGLGVTAVAAGRLAFSTGLFMFVAAASLGGAVMVTVARLVGARDLVGAQIARRNGASLLLAVGGAASLVLVAAPGWVARFFTSLPAVVEAATTPLRLVGLAGPLIGLCYANVAVLRALKENRIEMRINIASVWLVQLPIAFAGVFYQSLAIAFCGLLGYWGVRWIATGFVVRRCWSRMQAEETPAS